MDFMTVPRSLPGRREAGPTARTARQTNLYFQRLLHRRGLFLKDRVTKIGLAGQEGQSKRLRRPLPLEQFGFGPRIEDDMRRTIERSSHDELTLGLPFHRPAVLC